MRCKDTILASRATYRKMNRTTSELCDEKERKTRGELVRPCLSSPLSPWTDLLEEVVAILLKSA